MDSLLEEVNRYDGWCTKNVDKQMPRYKGWMLISNKAASFAKTIDGCNVLTSNGLTLKPWSEISGDEDDDRDYGIKRQ